MAEKVLTWQAHLPLTALCGTCLIQVWTKTAIKFLTLQEKTCRMNVAAIALLIFAITYKPRTYQFKTVRAPRYPSHFVGPSRSQVTGDQPS